MTRRRLKKLLINLVFSKRFLNKNGGKNKKNVSKDDSKHNQPNPLRTGNIEKALNNLTV